MLIKTYAHIYIYTENYLKILFSSIHLIKVNLSNTANIFMMTISLSQIFYSAQQEKCCVAEKNHPSEKIQMSENITCCFFVGGGEGR